MPPGGLCAVCRGIDTTATFVYNESGLRVQKTVNGVVTKYTLHGKNIVHMKTGNDELHFFYDAQNKPAVVVYNGTAYAYVKNLQGDVVAILDSNKNVVVSYVYDAWGRPISCSGTMATTLGKLNPFRYRGYVYDEETGLYYLRSRYYNPNLSRFVNADSIYDLNSGLFRFSQFTYCANSPVFLMDSDGQGIVLACVLIFGGIGMIIGGCVAADESKQTLGYVDGWWVLGGMLIGGAAGALIGFTVGTVAKAIGIALTAGSGGILGDEVYSSWKAAEDALRSTLNSATDVANRMFYTEWGTRVADAYNKATGVIAEAKYGYQSLTTFIQTEIAKDLYLLQNGIVSSVEWHFYVSQVSNSGGPSAPLLEALVNAGFKVIFH